MTRQQVVLATRNAKKLAELQRIVSAESQDVQVLGLADVAAYPEPAETERTFEGNALLKARACVAAAVCPALADDSGLAVDVLNQMPGVRSARWAGPGASDEDNNTLLLRQLADVPAAERTARFICAMAWCFRTVLSTSASGKCAAGLLSVRRSAMGSATIRCS